MTPHRRSVGEASHRVSCFRSEEDSEYWHSEPLEGAILDADER
ncbi:hypothetical protein [Natrialba sp. PRR66]|nr:hypothetical protein [Natrialba sp. PRR66]